MAVRREVLLIIALLVIIVLLVKVIEFFKVEVVEADARAFVLEELASKYPGADTEIMQIVPKYNQYEDKYFEVKAKVTLNPETPCPERTHVYYNYPVQNFVAQPSDVITSSCKVCTKGLCVMAFEEEAVIASHTFEGTSPIKAYIQAYPDAKPQVVEEQGSWFVVWDSSSADYYYTVNLLMDGNVAEVKRTEKN